MENAGKPRFRKVTYQFGLIWFLVNSSLLSITIYLAHQGLLFNPGIQLDGPLLSIAVGLVLSVSQGMLVRKYFATYFLIHPFNVDSWVNSIIIGLSLGLFMAYVGLLFLIFIGLAMSDIGTTSSLYRSHNPAEDFTLLVRSLFITSGVIGGGMIGSLQFAIIRKYVKSAVLWIVATPLSGGLSGLIYSHFVDLSDSESNRQNYNFTVAATSGKIGVVYGLITGVTMMIMLQKTIEHQRRSSIEGESNVE